MDRGVHSPAAAQLGVCRGDDRLDVLLGDVAAHQLDPHAPHHRRVLGKDVRMTEADDATIALGDMLAALGTPLPTGWAARRGGASAAATGRWPRRSTA